MITKMMQDLTTVDAAKPVSSGMQQVQVHPQYECKMQFARPVLKGVQQVQWRNLGSVKLFVILVENPLGSNHSKKARKCKIFQGFALKPPQGRHPWTQDPSHFGSTARFVRRNCRSLQDGLTSRGQLHP
jgi:hypothetical protein